MSELRWNPLLKTYTMVASNRQGRPNMPKDWCPFCPGSGKVPEKYEVLVYPNDFPALSAHPPEPEVTGSSLYQVEKSFGTCEVILYSPDHYITLPELPVEHIEKLIELWTERFIEIAKDEKVRYIFIFENRGAEVGVTMPHPHGQIYGYPFIPLKLKTELDNAKEYFQNTGKSILLEMNAQEVQFQKRIITENESFLCYLPFFTDYPYGIFIVSKEQRGSFSDFNLKERKDLATMLKLCTGALDSLFDKPFPYMMCIHQNPVNTEEYKDCNRYYNFHIEFYPPLRDANRIKYYAGSEMGAWAAANTRAVEDTAVELRDALQKFIKSGK